MSILQIRIITRERVSFEKEFYRHSGSDKQGKTQYDHHLEVEDACDDLFTKRVRVNLNH